MANKRKDWTGVRIGKLVAVGPHAADECGRWTWLMQCDCGAISEPVKVRA